MEGAGSEPGLWSQTVGSDPGLTTSLPGILGKPPLSLCLGFLTCNRGAMMMPTSQVCCEERSEQGAPCPGARLLFQRPS